MALALHRFHNTAAADGPVQGSGSSGPGHDRMPLRFLRLPGVRKLAGAGALRIAAKPLPSDSSNRSSICGIVTVVTQDRLPPLRITVAVLDAGDWISILNQWRSGDPFLVCCAES